MDVTNTDLANKRYIDNLLSRIRASRYISKAVVLGMDGKYDIQGKLDLARTEFMVGNDYVLKCVAENPKEFIAGISINPERRDALEELSRCVTAGAKLVKIIPCVQGFDPSHPKFTKFYRALADHNIPLLSHVGYEMNLGLRTDDPLKLRRALDEGVTVIAAHCCSYGLFYERYYNTLMYFMRAYCKFYADLSGLTLPNRVGMLAKIKTHPELHDRLLFGTDYPLPVFRWTSFGRVNLAKIRTCNPFDRQYQILKAWGIRFSTVEKLIT